MQVDNSRIPGWLYKEVRRMAVGCMEGTVKMLGENQYVSSRILG
jgi:hypothetical protein